METTDKEQTARALQQHQQDLEANIERILLDYEMEHEGPMEVDLSFVEGEGGPSVDEALRSRIQNMVDAFHRKPLVERSEVRVHKITAIDSDADGKIAVRIHYDYADED